MSQPQGTQILDGRYVLQSELGEGGMGTVYRAHDTKLDATVVVKVPHAAMLRDEEFAERFGREARSLVQLRHPHVVPIFDVGQHGGTPYAVMQFLGGGSLEELLAKGRQSWQDLGTWLSPISDALDFIHGMGFVHRDVKPANILFDEHGNAFLSDFGIVKGLSVVERSGSHQSITETGIVIGTPAYMAPEIILGQPYDGRADQYSLAVTIFEALLGRLPFSAPTPSAVMVEQSTKQPPELRQLDKSISPRISEAVARALAKSPNERFPSCSELCTAVLTGRGARRTTRSSAQIPKAEPLVESTSDESDTQRSIVTIATDDPPVTPLSRRRREATGRRNFFIAGITLGAVALIAAVFFLFRQGDSVPVANNRPPNAYAKNGLARQTPIPVSPPAAKSNRHRARRRPRKKKRRILSPRHPQVCMPRYAAKRHSSQLR